MINSRQKGARFERELAKVFREHGYEARRGQQYCGANGDADVVGLPFIHVECKAVERLNIFDAMAQSKHDAKEGEIPIVCHKKNYTDWLVTMRIEDWFKLYREWECSYDSK
jgi:Holliday junction resolvase